MRISEINPLRRRRGRIVLALSTVALALALSGTALAAPPTATTNPAEHVTANSAWISGNINAQGHQTTWHFEWATDAEYGTSGPYPHSSPDTRMSFWLGPAEVPLLFTDTIVGMPLENLDPSTTYHFTVVATSSEGTTLGGDQTFTTAAS